MWFSDDRDCRARVYNTPAPNGTRRLRQPVLLTLVCAAALALAACRPVGAPPTPATQAVSLVNPDRPNVLLITSDTTRADRIGCYGFPLARTPNIDSLAAEGVRCTDAITAAPITMPSHATIMTGLFPPAHGVRDNGTYSLSDDVTTLAERLKAAGYSTHAVVSAMVLGRLYNLTQGFDGYDDDLYSEDRPPMFMIPDRPADRTADLALNYLSAPGAQADPRPFFLWVHFFDPHQPLQARVPNRHLIPTPYDAEIAAVDIAVGRLVGALDAMGKLDKTLIVFCADHGESLGEHEESTHAIFIYDATMRVPLILRHPKSLPAGRVYDGPVRTADIAPTVLDVLGFPPPTDMQGVSLLAAFAGRAPAPNLPQYCESLLSEVGFGMAPLYGVRLEGHKYIRAPKPELYDLRSDPGELHNRIGDNRALAARLDGELEKILKSCARRASAARQNPLDRATSDMLRAMGYLASDEQRSGMGGIDPKDGIKLHNKLEQARHRAQRGDWPGCERLLRDVLKENPANLSALNTLPMALLRQDRQKEAEEVYARSLQIDPKQHRILHQLGALRLREGKLDDAEKLFRRALDIAPRFVESMVFLGYVELLRGNRDGAESWYRRALADDPAFPRAYLQYADLEYLRGNHEQALAYYEKSLAAAPRHFNALNQAGLCAMKNRQSQAAVDYFDRAEKVRPDSWLPPYNRACLAAQTDRGDEAIQLLKIAVQRGFANPRQLQADSDLAAIRSHSEYPALLTSVRAAAAAAKQDRG